ncbi:uncharacterized protein LOC116804702 [Drosophila mojavensis]|uniref:uncharacterized protein LOC116804702 n=1 Tax=Drosophila mojavensis TaxID=7230 RepID=UPI0013EEB971|nr:uncharacterized protein LOC116804702 [Drosophila mojavensis]XP_043865294.1 uncharacterized protein LOC116804702 [Drosophila mojavensis]
MSYHRGPSCQRSCKSGVECLKMWITFGRMVRSWKISVLQLNLSQRANGGGKKRLNPEAPCWIPASEERKAQDLEPDLKEFLETELTLFENLEGVSHITEHSNRMRDKRLKQRYYPKNLRTRPCRR